MDSLNYYDQRFALALCAVEVYYHYHDYFMAKCIL